MNDTRSLLWPLAFLFLLSAGGAFIGFMYPLFSSSGAFDRTLAYLLLAVAFVTGVGLYAPRFWQAIKVPTTEDLSSKLSAIHTGLFTAAGNQDQIAAITSAIGNLGTAVTKLSAQIDKLNRRFDADGGDVRGDIAAVRTSVDGALRIDVQTIKSLLERGDVRTSLDGITTLLGSGPALSTALAGAKASIEALDKRFSDGGDVAKKIETIASDVVEIKNKK